MLRALYSDVTIGFVNFDTMFKTLDNFFSKTNLLLGHQFIGQALGL